MRRRASGSITVDRAQTVKFVESLLGEDGYCEYKISEPSFQKKFKRKKTAVLEITVQRGYHIRATEDGRKCDPFAEIQVTAYNPISKTSTRILSEKTRTLSQTLDPVWNQKFSVEITPMHTSSNISLKIQLFDDSYVIKEPLGIVELDLKKEVKERQEKSRFVSKYPIMYHDKGITEQKGELSIVISHKDFV